MDIVERLRADRAVSQFNAGGVLERYDATPTDLEMEAAREIERLRIALRDAESQRDEWRAIALENT